MEATSTRIEGVMMLRPRLFEDDRGTFYETWNHSAFEHAVGESVSFVQSNESKSKKGVLRGFHFQVPPHAQGKLVRVVQGRVLDVAVDLRKHSPTFGQHIAAELSADNRWQMWLPPGMAHGFLALGENTVFSYMCTEQYHPESERSLQWDDPLLGIDWGMDAPNVSAKDARAGAFSDFESPF